MNDEKDAAKLEGKEGEEVGGTGRREERGIKQLS